MDTPEHTPVAAAADAAAPGGGGAGAWRYRAAMVCYMQLALPEDVNPDVSFVNPKP